MMMPVAFSVRGDVHELRPQPRVGEAAHQAVGEALSVVEEPLERDTLGNRAIVKKDIDRFSRGKANKIRAARIDAISSDVLPASRAALANPFRLARREDGVLDAVGRPR